jgi:hypothetical protein
MNIGYNQILQMRRAEAKANQLGFMFAYPKHGWHGSDGEALIALKPKDADSLPIYARDAQIFSGTLDAVEHFMLGIEWARKYDKMLKLTDDNKRERKEQDVRNKKMFDILKDEDNKSITT